ncbi:carboxylate--amine ligase [Rhodanobacter glycinis]|uniref:Carboxylate--amine ligase n=1 Tax=Rhodanobacter glycinis TaxID=582702 RepID=A0A5B9E4V3_9GAMM|nr:carboxylate--amine ligase [Rhodanobacter glycinis]QEE25650.1 carboxylate--amine ligase [Rhodanobacter glycinis]
MAKIQIGGAGGAPSNNFIRSLRESSRKDHLIGTTCVPADLFLADTEEKYVVPYATADNYSEKVLGLISKVRPDFIHLQNDYEVRAISRIRDKVVDLGIGLYLPDAETVENCVDKQKSYAIWKAAGVRVPETILLNNENDLKVAFEKLGPKIWIRAIEGGGGRGALPAENYEFAKIWIDRFKGWGTFTASELLSEKTITWQSIWFEGELVVAQTRKRRSWNFGNRTLSGVTGITGVGETCSDPLVDRIAQDAILAIDKRPHGIFSADMTYDFSGFPKPTEINIGRFFTTHYFFTKAGLNFPEIYCNIALDETFPVLEKKVNPLPDGLIWIRGMDREPVLTTVDELEKLERQAS